jgi:hypothetical protein
MGWKRVLSLLFLSMLLVIASLISLCHSESNLGKDPYCPACNFQSSCVAIDVIDAFQLPELAVHEIVGSLDCSDYASQVAFGYLARSPPRG